MLVSPGAWVGRLGRWLARRGLRLWRSRRVRFESLEGRRMWAADGGAIMAGELLETGDVQHNSALPADVNGDGAAAPEDGLLLVNAINQILAEPQEAWGQSVYLDVDADHHLGALDFAAYLQAMRDPSLFLKPVPVLEELLGAWCVVCGSAAEPHVGEGSGTGEEVTEEAEDVAYPDCAAEPGAPWCSEGQPAEGGSGPTPPSPPPVPEPADEPADVTQDSPDGAVPDAGPLPAADEASEQPPGEAVSADSGDPSGASAGLRPAGADLDRGTADPTPSEQPDDSVPASDQAPAGEQPTGTDEQLEGGGEGDEPAPSLCQTSDEQSELEWLVNPCAAAPAGRPQEPPTCPATLSGGTVREAERFTLALTFDPNCVEGYEVDWGDGVLESYASDEQAVHVYEDDDPSQTPSDDYQIAVILFVALSDVDRQPGIVELQTVVTVHNVPPVPADDSGTGFVTDEDSLLTTGSVFWNDEDVSFFDKTQLVMVEVDDRLTKGKVRHVGGGHFEYDPAGEFECLAEGERATDHFKYRMRDDDDETAIREAMVTITITGRRESYVLDYSGGIGSEDPQQPAQAVFTITPAARCGSVLAGFRPAVYEGPLDLPMADASDLQTTRGVVEFREGSDTVKVDLLPVDDRAVELDEWWYFAVDTVRTAEYEILPFRNEAYLLIEDNEWRFVGESVLESASFGPLPIEAPSPPFGSAWLEGELMLRGDIPQPQNQSADSVLTTEAISTARLVRPSQYFNATRDTVSIDFVCDSQSGYLYRAGYDAAAETQSGPLETLVGLNWTIHTLSSSEKVVVIDYLADVVVGGEVSRTNLIEVGGRLGDQAKGNTGGRIEVSSRVTYPAGGKVHHHKSISVHCRRGAGE